MALIDTSYFVGPINIANTNRPEISERLILFIEKYQTELLRDLLGYELSTAFETGIADFDPDGSNSTIEQKWLDLIEGSTYTYNSRTRKFNGLPDIIANYVYWHWTKDQYTQSVALGEVKGKAENADNANPAEKLVRAWNEMCDNIFELYYYLKDTTDTYPEWTSRERCWVENTFKKNNLWGF